MTTSETPTVKTAVEIVSLVKDALIPEGHNPDSNCLQCCVTSARLSNLLDKLEGILQAPKEGESEPELPPMLKIAMKMAGLR